MATLEELKEWYNQDQIDIEADPDFNIIKKLYKKDNNENEIEILNNHSSNIYNAIGIYFETIEKNYDDMKIYYLMAIEKGNRFAMYNYACYLERIEKNYDDMKKYYLMAIEKGNFNAMCNYAYYLETIERNYDDMKKYYLMAIEKGDRNAMNNYAHYFEDNKKYEELEKYYKMAIEKGNIYAMYNYARYLKDNKKYEEMERYLEMILMYKTHEKYKEVIDILVGHYCKMNKYTKLFELLINHDQERINTIFNKINIENFEIDEKILKLIQEKINIENIKIPIIKILYKLINEKINLLEIHFKYTVNGLGYEQAKEDFYKKLN